jgi:hypothetical protein
MMGRLNHDQGELFYSFCRARCRRAPFYWFLGLGRRKTRWMIPH